MMRKTGEFSPKSTDWPISNRWDLNGKKARQIVNCIMRHFGDLFGKAFQKHWISEVWKFQKIEKLNQNFATFGRPHSPLCGAAVSVANVCAGEHGRALRETDRAYCQHCHKCFATYTATLSFGSNFWWSYFGGENLRRNDPSNSKVIALLQKHFVRIFNLKTLFESNFGKKTMPLRWQNELSLYLISLTSKNFQPKRASSPGDFGLSFLTKAFRFLRFFGLGFLTEAGHLRASKLSNALSISALSIQRIRLFRSRDLIVEAANAERRRETQRNAGRSQRIEETSFSLN